MRGKREGEARRQSPHAKGASARDRKGASAQIQLMLGCSIILPEDFQDTIDRIEKN